MDVLDDEYMLLCIYGASAFSMSALKQPGRLPQSTCVPCSRHLSRK